MAGSPISYLFSHAPDARVLADKSEGAATVTAWPRRGQQTSAVAVLKVANLWTLTGKKNKHLAYTHLSFPVFMGSVCSLQVILILDEVTQEGMENRRGEPRHEETLEDMCI